MQWPSGVTAQFYLDSDWAIPVCTAAHAHRVVLERPPGAALRMSRRAYRALASYGRPLGNQAPRNRPDLAVALVLMALVFPLSSGTGAEALIALTAATGPAFSAAIARV